jgi:hypothetical protein
MSEEVSPPLFENEEENNKVANNGVVNNEVVNNEVANNENGNENNNSGQEEETGVEVSSGASEEEGGIFLGDRLSITWRGGKTTGLIYYIDESLIRILPDGTSNVLQDFPVDDSGFSEELEITEIEIVPGPKTSFVKQRGFRVGQKLDAYNQSGALVSTFEITDITDGDKIRIRDSNGDERILDFQGKGIDRTEDFVILRVQPVSVENKALSPEEMAAENAAKLAMSVDGLEDNEDIILDDLQDLGALEIPDYQMHTELMSSQKVYDENQQKSDMLSDLNSMLDLPSQQNPLLRKRIRTIVEMMSMLKQTTLSFRENIDTEVKEAKISLTSLSEILKNNVPIILPVLDTKRVIVTEFGDEDETMNGIHIYTLQELTEGSREFLDKLGGLPVPEEGVGLPRWYQALQLYTNQFPLGDEYTQNGYQFTQDTEYFRQQPPGSTPLPGLANGTKDGRHRDDAYDGENTRDYIVNISQSLRRGHGPSTFALPKGGTDVWKTGSRAPLKGHVIFPYKAVRTGGIGAKRTGQLWSTVLRSMAVKTSIELLVDMLGGIQNEPDAQKVIFLDIHKQADYDVPFSEFLKTVVGSEVILGPGDLFAMNADLGIQGMEPDLEQQTIVQNRVVQVIASLRNSIQQTRQALEEKTVSPVMEPLLSDSAGKLLANAMASQPYLANIIKNMGLRTPGYRSVDISIMASLLLYSQDFAFAVLGNNKDATQREAGLANRNTLLETIDASRKQRSIEENRGAEPVINSCVHVKELELIRRVKDDTERMKLLTKFVGRFQGGRKENWIICNYCNENLICQHEAIQIQQFLNPLQYLALQKEIILNYAGGTFGANHICRNCGNKVAELGYDTSLEYDDNGKPMMGRSVLVDEDAVIRDKLEELFDIPVEAQNEIVFETDDKTNAYKILLVLTDKIGVSLDGVTIKRIVDRAGPKMQVGLEKDYVREKGMPSFQTHKAGKQIGVVSALLLLELQCHKPNYQPAFWLEGCKPGFGGYPLLVNSNPDEPEQSVGLFYLVCAVLGINNPSFPWNSLSIRSGDARKKFIHFHIKMEINEELTNSQTLRALELKRQYLKDVYGTSATGSHLENIPQGFLPHVETERDATKNAASEPTTEGARGHYGETVMADTWIRAVNRLAMETTPLIENTPFTETGCCKSPLMDPGFFFRDKNLPKLPKDHPLAPSYKRQTILYTPMNPRPLELFNAVPNMEVAYRLFLQICYKGDRVGLPHEIGYDNKCDWCDIEIPVRKYDPDRNAGNNSKANIKEKVELQEAEVKADLDRQGIPLNEDGFRKLLDVSKSRFIFQPYRTPVPLTPLEIMEHLSLLDPQPIVDVDWTSGLNTALKNLESLSVESSAAEIQAGLAPLREMLEDSMEALRPVLNISIGGKTVAKIVETILNQPPSAMINILRSQFLVPAQRLATDYETTIMTIPKVYKLEEEHTKKLESMLNDHTSYIMSLSFNEKGKRKLEKYVEMLSSILRVLEEVRPSRLQIMSKMSDNLKYFLLKEIFRVAIIGPLGFLADSSMDIEEEREEEDDTPEEDDKTLKKFILEMLVKYDKNQTLAYNPEVVRDEIAKRKELEKNTFINRLDKIQDDEHRKIEKQIQRLGAKSSNNDWSARGTTFGEIYKQDDEINTYAAMTGMDTQFEGEEDGYMGVGQVFDGNGDD